jgi:hypothetical protein
MFSTMMTPATESETKNASFPATAVSYSSNVEGVELVAGHGRARSWVRK